jgi:hypothetical protein
MEKTNAQRTYEGSLRFNDASVQLKPKVRQQYSAEDASVLYESIKEALLNYGCTSTSKDPGTAGSPVDYLSGEQAFPYQLEDKSRGKCCDGSDPQIVCEIDTATGNMKCWAECPD